MGKKKSTLARDDSNQKTVCRNRKARHQYDILDQLECGLVLMGSEVKSIRNGNISIDEAYARINDGELWLVGCNIAEYPEATVMNHEPLRQRKLLLHKKQFIKFAEAAGQKGLTMIPLSVYFSRGIVKLSIAVARGRKLHDKRDKLRQKADRNDMRREMLSHQ